MMESAAFKLKAGVSSGSTMRRDIYLVKLENNDLNYF